jgi:GNAT superfamily N-acetyltransferase
VDLLTHPPRWAPLVGPGVWTDLVVAHLGGAEITDEGDHLRVVTPGNPTFWWGNYLDVLAPSRAADVDLWLARFEAAFPDARHRTFGLPGPVSDAWLDRGFTPEVVVTLLADGPVEAGPPVPGYSVRVFGEDAPWQDAVELHVEHHDGPATPERYREFTERRVESQARMTAAGTARFLGAYEADRCVAHLGAVRCGEVGRYQSVLTHAGHRGRGLAAHLVGLAATWLRAGGCDRLVIVTEEDNPAGRLYRRLGFDGTDLAYGVSVPDVARLSR